MALVRWSRWIVPVAAFAALTACSEDSGASDGASPGGSAGFELNRTVVGFSAVEGGARPGSESVLVTLTSPAAAYIVVGYPPGEAEPAWLGMSLTQAGGADWNLALSVNGTTGLLGSYAAVVRIAIADANQRLIGYRDVTVTYVVSPRLAAAPANLAFEHFLGDANSAKTVSVTGTAGGGWTAEASESWVILDATNGTVPATVGVAFNPSGLGVGLHAATITFSGGIARATVGVTLEVVAPALLGSPGALSFSGVNGATLPTRGLTVAMNDGDAVAWTATPSAGWIRLSQGSGTTPSSIVVSVDPSVGPLASGSHTGTIVLAADLGGTTSTATIDVSLMLTKATLSLVPPTLVLGGPDGLSLAAQPVRPSLDTGTNGHPWSATASDGWIGLSTSTGWAWASSPDIQVTPIATGLTGGTRTGSVDFTATVNGDTLTASLPVTFNLEAHRIQVSAPGVALASMPGAARLERRLRVTDSLGAATGWTAAADQEWLTVTASGSAGDELVLTAAPGALATDTLHYATVTVASDDPTVENVETVRVGFWIGSAAPVSGGVAGGFREIVADPIRPWVYVHARGTDLSVFNLHTGGAVATLPSLGGVLGEMAISGDGSTLYVGDKANGWIVPVALDTLTAGAPWDLVTAPGVYPRLAWTRTDGRALLVVSDGTVRDALDGRTLATFFASTAGDAPVVVSGDGKVLFAPGGRTLAYSVLGGGTVTLGTALGHVGTRDGALNEDGSIVYAASGAPYNWPGYSTATGLLAITLGGVLPYPGNVEVGWDGRILCGRYSTGADDVFLFDATGAQLGSYRLADPNSLVDDTLRLSGDGLRVLGLTGNLGTEGALRYVTVPAYP